MIMEWRKRPRNNVENLDNDKGMIEGAQLSNIVHLGSRPLQEHNNNADMANEHSGAESSLLGLRLNKDELLKMIRKEFSQDIRAKGRYKPTVTSLNFLDTQSSVIKLPQKPSKFYAHILRIGTWQWISRYDGDLVAKFYYANKKLVWEILDVGLKRKIEINWENISALKVICPYGGPGTLEIMLYQRPRFFREANQQPGMATMWLGTKDFTGGQASIHRRHVLQCAAEILNKHIVKLLSSNYRLYSLSQQDNIVQQDPCFERYSESQVSESSNANDLYQRYGYQLFWGQKFGASHNGISTLNPSSGPQFRETIPMPIGRNHNGLLDSKPVLTRCSDIGHSSAVTGGPSGGLEQHRNMFSVSSEKLRQAQLNFSSGRACAPVFTETTSGGLQQSSNMFNSSSSLQTRSCKIVSSGSRIMDDDAANYMVNPRKRPNLLTSMGAYADSHVRPEDVRKLVKDEIIRRSSMTELELSHYAFNDTTTTQSFKQNISSATMVLEKICHDLLEDGDTEMRPTGVAEDAKLMSAMNSLSSLLQPQEVDPDAGNSGAGGGSS